jgi:ketosteroid isomerase-like protein
MNQSASPDNRKLVESLYAAFGRRDLAAIAALTSPDIMVTQSTSLPWGGHYTGFEGLQRFLTTLVQHVDSKLEIERLVDAGDHVVAVGWTVGSVRANGKPFKVPIAHVWKIRDGKLAAFSPYIENALMLEALRGQTN